MHNIQSIKLCFGSLKLNMQLPNLHDKVWMILLSLEQVYLISVSPTNQSLSRTFKLATKFDKTNKI